MEQCDPVVDLEAMGYIGCADKVETMVGVGQTSKHIGYCTRHTSPPGLFDHTDSCINALNIPAIKPERIRESPCAATDIQCALSLWVRQG